MHSWLLDTTTHHCKYFDAREHPIARSEHAQSRSDAGECWQPAEQSSQSPLPMGTAFVRRCCGNTRDNSKMYLCTMVLLRLGGQAYQRIRVRSCKPGRPSQSYTMAAVDGHNNRHDCFTQNWLSQCNSALLLQRQQQLRV